MSLLQRVTRSLKWRCTLLRQELSLGARRIFRPFVEIAGIKLPLGSHLSRLVVAALDSGSYEDPERRVLQKCLRVDDRVMELGAGLGFLSIYCARIVGSHQVDTYEGNPWLEPAIRKAYALNGVQPNLHLCLLGDEPGEREFHVHRHFSCSSVAGMAPPGHTAIKVPVRSFQAEFARVRPTLLIMDVEGSEVELLTGRLFPSSLRAIVVEVHPGVVEESSLAEMRAWLNSQGFIGPTERDHDTELFLRDPTLVDRGTTC